VKFQEHGSFLYVNMKENYDNLLFVGKYQLPKTDRESKTLP